MPASWNIQINPTHLLIWQDGMNIPITLPQVVIINNRNEVVEIGETLEDVAARIPESVLQNDGLRSSSILALAETDPGQAANLLLMAANFTIRKSGKKTGLFFKPAVKIQIEWPEYARLSAQIQAWFVYSCQINHFLRVTSLIINGEAINSKTIYMADRTISLGGTAAILANICIVLYLILSFAPIPQTIEATFWNLVMILGGFVCITVWVLYPPILVFTAIWKRTYQKKLPDSISKLIMNESKLGVPAFWVNFLYRSSENEHHN